MTWEIIKFKFFSERLNTVTTIGRDKVRFNFFLSLYEEDKFLADVK